MLYTDIRFWLMLFPAAWAIISILDYLLRKPTKTVAEARRDSEFPNYKILGLQRHRRSDKTWIVLEAVLGVSCLVLLAFDGLLFWLWITKPLKVDLDIASIAFLTFIVGFPLYSLIDIVIIEPRIRKSGRSKVAEPAVLVVEGELDKLFKQCQDVLGEMGGIISHLDIKSKLIKADLNKDEITIKIEHIRGLKYRILLLSDSKLLSVRFDFGRNKRNIGTFTRKFIHSG